MIRVLINQIMRNYFVLIIMVKNPKRKYLIKEKGHCALKKLNNLWNQQDLKYLK